MSIANVGLDKEAVQKHIDLVDLVKSFQTNIYLQNLASIQPRTSLNTDTGYHFRIPHFRPRRGLEFQPSAGVRTRAARSRRASSISAEYGD